MIALLERAIGAYALFCLRLFILAGEALGDAVLYIAGYMPGYNDEQRVTSLVIVLYATVAGLSAAVGVGLILGALLVAV